MLNLGILNSGLYPQAVEEEFENFMATIQTAFNRQTNEFTGLLQNGTYTPTAGIVGNISAYTMNPCQYAKVGNVVIVSGSASVTVTADATLTGLDISLPVATNFTQLYECAGHHVADLGDGDPGIVRATTVSLAASAGTIPNSARLRWTSAGLTGVQTRYFHFTYQVL